MFVLTAKVPRWRPPEAKTPRLETAALSRRVVCVQTYIDAVTRRSILVCIAKFGRQRSLFPFKTPKLSGESREKLRDDYAQHCVHEEVFVVSLTVCLVNWQH